ncbi:hypothetical protein [Aquimarina algicola]|uniref:Uncharacterized protein n=1 Tax=Aquimarina algicola TaxID=2589995 RepID=A0A504J8R8_9FLAO|nr:hypothetical protein [Aquimarina algicola]TPN86984.1 hypothetical protein FHK87_05160 [Aquimarina algicola]
MKNNGHISSLTKYQNEKIKYLLLAKEFDDSGEKEIDDKIKKYLLEMLDWIDAIEIKANADKNLNTFFNKVKESLTPTESIQAIVFYFNRDNGKLFLSAYRSVKPDAFVYQELSNINANYNNRIIGEIGPIQVLNYNEIYENVLSCKKDEIEEYELECENDHIHELMILKAYALFEEIFLSIDLNSIFSETQIKYPFYSYIQEHDGGYSNLLSILKN